MHPRTLATVGELENADWFARVGARDTSAAIILSSWEDAIAHCGSVEWQSLCLEAVNQYCERLVERSIARFNMWNEIAVEVKRTTEPLVCCKIATVVREHSLPDVFEHMV